MAATGHPRRKRTHLLTMIRCRGHGGRLHRPNLSLLHLLCVEVSDESGGGGGGRGGSRGKAGVHVILLEYLKGHAQLLQQLPTEPRLQGLLRQVDESEALEGGGQRSGPEMSRRTMSTPRAD